MSCKQKNGQKKGQWAAAILSMAVGFACGFLMVWYFDTVLSHRSAHRQLLTVSVMLASLVLSLVAQIIIHEGGHLVFGLASGYRFGSFRVFSWIWVKENGRIRCKRLSLAGTAGQCLMNPPPIKDGKIPVVLYNLGGCIANLVASLLALACMFLFGKAALISVACAPFLLIGVLLAVTNGIPMHAGLVDNDGYNALSLSRDPLAAQAFWKQLAVYGEITRGVRLRDMPDEWFALPNEKDLKNSMMATVAVFACNRLSDAHRFAEADDLAQRLLSADTAINGLHRALLTCERICFEAVTQKRPEVMAALLSVQQKQYMKQMKKISTVLRTVYIYALLCENDYNKAEDTKRRFEKLASRYPYPNDLLIDREWMELAEKKLENMNVM